MIDIEKRKRVMQRSMKLGHCICNPKQACPCDTFKARDICPCAGERAEEAVEEVRLTQLVEKAGCASKINQNDLKRVLANLPEVIDPRVLVGSNTCDDAGVYALDDHTALVQTVDVFTPSVDDAYTFGQIAAANSLSDVYAMGGRPLTALSVIGFPIEQLSHRVMTQMLRGGLDKMREAGVAVVGGHSINDPTPKFGYAVTGVVDPRNMITNAGAQPGDVLVLTKPLGVGIISFAAQCDKTSKEAIDGAARVMTMLNKSASEVMAAVGVNAATDVTGFGLFGHLGEMARQSGVGAELWAESIPVLQNSLEYAQAGIISGGCERNREHSGEFVDADHDVPAEFEWLLYDPQTSGGMLMAVPPGNLDALISRLYEAGVETASVIGRMVAESIGRMTLHAGRYEPDRYQESKAMEKTKTCCGPAVVEPCCANPPGDGAESAVEERFWDFMRAVNSDGAIPTRTKELMALALSIAMKCEPCVRIHIDKARAMGITEQEIEEAVWMAVSFGGAPTLMFYNKLMDKD